MDKLVDTKQHQTTNELRYIIEKIASRNSCPAFIFKLHLPIKDIHAYIPLYGINFSENMGFAPFSISIMQ
jgi:hypothetical protein